MNLIFSAFATLAGYRENADANRGTAAYYRCLVVALASAKAQNPGCCVALVTNAPPPQPFLGQLKEAGVVNSVEEFLQLVHPDDCDI